MATLMLFLTILSVGVLVGNTLSWVATWYACTFYRPWYWEYVRLNWLDAAATLAACFLLARWLA